MYSSETTFKFILVVSIIVLIMLAVMSTVNCQQYKDAKAREAREVRDYFSSYSQVQLNPLANAFALPQTNSTQSVIQIMLYNALNNSQNWSSGLNVSLASGDVFVLPSEKDVMWDLTQNTANPSALTGPTLDSMACSVPASTYVSDDTRHCLTVKQAASSGYPCRARVFDSIYRICSTCFRVQIKNSNTMYGSSAAYMMLLLRPFAMSFQNSSTTGPVAVQSMNTTSSSSHALPSPSDVTVSLSSSSLPYTPSNSLPTSVVVYYLDYVGPIFDVLKNPSSAPTITSTLDPMSQTLSYNNSVTYNFNGTTDISSVTSASGSTSASAAAKKFPGMLNAAKVAVQMGYVPGAAVISSEVYDDSNYNSTAVPF